MKLYTETEQYKLYEGSMLDMLDVIPENSIDAIVTDPPYELNFMNKGWDRSGIAFQKETWEKCLKVLKPGGYLLSFGGSRTFHRIACAIEDAGFEIRDTIMWLYGSGMPKSMNIAYSIDKKLGHESVLGDIKPGHSEFVGRTTTGHIGFDGAMSGFDHPWMHDSEKYENSHYQKIPTSEEAKRWDGWGTAIKPAFEGITVARKPCEGSTTDNVLKYGVGGINIDECRVHISQEDVNMINAKSSKNQTDNYNHKDTKKYGDYALNIATPANEGGRFPANVILTYDDSDFDEVCGGCPDTKPAGNKIGKEINKNLDYNASSYKLSNNKCPKIAGDNGGSASRYFYCAKASKLDRDEGLPEGTRNIHPTLKPVNLMRYLVRLVSPKGSTILDPFNGSGSTGKAVMFENRLRNANYKYIGIDLSEEYLQISKARIDYAMAVDVKVDHDGKIITPKKPDSVNSKLSQYSLFYNL